MINGIDTEIVKILQGNARISNAEIARTVGLAPSAVFERIRKLEEKGIIRGYHADVDPRAVELGHQDALPLPQHHLAAADLQREIVTE